MDFAVVIQAEQFKRESRALHKAATFQKVRAKGFEPSTIGFGVHRSTVGATPSSDTISPLTARNRHSSLLKQGSTKQKRLYPISYDT